MNLRVIEILDPQKYRSVLWQALSIPKCSERY
jgi:hypothetical protein